MDGQRFDMIGKWLATRDSRRQTLRVLAAGALALGLGRLDLDEVVAGCKHVGQKCAKNSDCCAGLQCKQKKCVCKNSTATCGDACCDRGQECLAKKGSDVPPVCCAPERICGPLCCPPDRLCVGNAPNPIDPSPDPNDLYRCICHDGFEEDKDGTCVCPHPCGDDCCEADDGETCCPTGRGQRQCVQLSSSDKHCGACGNACPKELVCENGKCICPHPLIACDGNCVRPSDDSANCGRCGNRCGSNTICHNGACVCEFVQCQGVCLPKGSCCSDADCLQYAGNFDCCEGPGCAYFGDCPHGCVDVTNAGDPDDDPPGFIICTVL